MHAHSNTFADIRFAINRMIKPDAYNEIKRQNQYFFDNLYIVPKEDEIRSLLSF